MGHPVEEKTGPGAFDQGSVPPEHDAMNLRRANLAALFSLALFWIAAAPAAAQSEPDEPLPPLEMSSNPLKLQGLGIELHLPIGSTSKQERMSRNVKANILGKDDAWLLTLSTQTSSNTAMGAEEALQRIMEDLQKMYGVTKIDDPSQPVGTFARPLAPIEPISFDGGTAYRFFLHQPSADADKSDTVRGIALIKLAPGQMLVWDMSAPETNYALAKQAMDVTLAAVRTTANPLDAAQREIALKTGQRLIEGISETRMHDLFESFGEHWYRLYRDTENGEAEIGYRRIKAWAGTRSELGGVDSNAGSETGYLVQIEARTLDENSTGSDRLIYDSKGTYFVSEDFSSESWNLMVVVKQGRKSTTFTEVGAREGFEELMVSTNDPSGRGDTLKLPLKKEGYLPLALSLMLPTLLAETEATGDIAFYTYRSDASAVTFRHDSIRHDTDNPEQWVHRTSVSVDSPQIVKQLENDGSIVREELPGGRFWVPTTVQELTRIWREKRLPMD